MSTDVKSASIVFKCKLNNIMIIYIIIGKVLIKYKVVGIDIKKDESETSTDRTNKLIEWNQR